MIPAASGSRRPRVLLAAGPVGRLTPREAAVALAHGFVDHADVAVAGLAEGGPALGAALSEPEGELEVLSAGWVATADRLIAVGCDPEPVSDPLRASSAGLGRLVGYALQRRPLATEPSDHRVIIDLTGSTSHDAGAGLLAELASVRSLLAGVDLVGVVPPGQHQDRLLGLRGITSRKGRALALSTDRMLAVDADLELFAKQTAPEFALVDGAGAAGGLGFALLALGGRLAVGASETADRAGLDRALQRADLVVTACDSFDFGSRGGGVVAELAARCEAFEVPLVVISPVVGMSGREMRTLGVESAHPVDPGTGSADGLTRTARRLAEGWTPRW